MQLSISGQQFEVTDSLKEYISEKMVRIQRHFDHVNDTHVVLHVEKQRHQAEATINARGTAIHANANADDMYAAIDALADKLDSQIRKHKDKKSDHHQPGGALKEQAFE
jgi:putative sigma-54 modulation protein